MDLKKIKTPLRYPGGKAKALNQIMPAIQAAPPFREFREPMVGGGSIFLNVKQLSYNKSFWINDINEDLYYFWKQCKKNIDRLIKEVRKIKAIKVDGKKLYTKYKAINGNSPEFDRAVRFFILNRISFSGCMEAGGYSRESFEKRFTYSSIDRLYDVGQFLNNVRITNKSYEKVIHAPGKGVLIFLDPPYFSSSGNLYGKRGDIHKSFDHNKFAENMKKCKHNWLITYDDSPDIRKLFSFAHQYQWKLQYGMNNYKQKKADIGEELFITNYKIRELKDKKIK